MPTWFWCGCLAFGVSAAATPIVRRMAVRANLFDRPDAGLKPHAKPIPFLGGLAIYAGWLAALVAAILHGAIDWMQGGAIILGGSVMVVTGLVDDIRHLSPRVRLAVQAVVALGLLATTGIGRSIYPALVGEGADIGGSLSRSSGLNSEILIAWVVAGSFCMFTLAGATNSTNLIDGLDGLCGGISALAAAGFLALLVLLSVDADNQAASDWPCVCSAVAGACLAFLIYNFNPASIFMGDNGALLLGYNAALMIIVLTEAGGWRGLAGALLVFGFPLFDTSLAITRRALNRRPLFVGDRSHFYDQLRDRGLGVRATVITCYMLGALFGLTGLATTKLPDSALIGLCILLPCAAAIVCRQAGLLRVDTAAQRSIPSTLKP